MKTVFIVDDEKEICESIKMILEYEDYHVEYSTDVFQAMEKLKFDSYDTLLLDIQMPGKNGFEFLEWMNSESINIPVIMISAYSSLNNAVKATKLGAFDFIEKPIEREKLLISIRNSIKQIELVKENKHLKANISEETKILGESQSIKKILETIEKVAKTEARVLITGENGTGKELVAKAIHQKSNRFQKPFIEVNCAAIPNELIESELFGHEKGSFTGALQQRIGKFELANNGTLFLDEIGDMSPQAQAKVLRAIEDGKIERVGGNTKISVDVRIISATNKDLKTEISAGNFREDLFHRLNVIPIKVPSLQERPDDIPILVDYFSKIYIRKNGLSNKIITPGAMKLIQNQQFSGNVRELRNLVERILILVSSDEIYENHLYGILNPNQTVSDALIDMSKTFQEFKDNAEKVFILKQLEKNNWNISKTADVLEIQRSHLYGKMKKFGIEKGI